MKKSPKQNTNKYRFWTSQTLKKYSKSVWFFPALLMIPLIFLSAFKISGSSIGVYHGFFFGNQKDSNLIAGQPRSIRSDEWLVNTQMTIAQKTNDFNRSNKNIGNGEDMSLIIDVPYKDWSTLFKPQNIAFFVLPFEVAFALRWWLLGYLLIISCYFFIDTVLPKHRTFAALFSVALFFSPFVQWWYLYSTAGSLYYALFAGTIFIKMLKAKSHKTQLLWAGLLAFDLACFTIILYPPFQIASALVVGVVSLGFFIEYAKRRKLKEILPILLILGGSVSIAVIVVLAYLLTRNEAVSAIMHTAYPGKRVQLSGGYDIIHLMSGSLDMQLQYVNRASRYLFLKVGANNQSEASNFILLMPFLLIPGVYLQIKDFLDKKSIDWPLLMATLLAALFTIRLFVPHFNTLFKLLQLDKVPNNRLLLGIGLLSFVYVVLLIRNISKQKNNKSNGIIIPVYSALVFVTQLLIGLNIKHLFPGYIGNYKIVVISVAVSAIVYLLLTKKYAWSAALLLVLSIASTIQVNPLYRGTDILTNSALSKAVSAASGQSHGEWATESLVYENIPATSGNQSLSGVYVYPQLGLWKTLDTGSDSSNYNRYAHVNFDFDRNPQVTTKTNLRLVGGDNFHIQTEPCSDFLKQNNVHFLLALAPLDGQDSCAKLVNTVIYPAVHFYIYKLTY